MTSSLSYGYCLAPDSSVGPITVLTSKNGLGANNKLVIYCIPYKEVLLTMFPSYFVDRWNSMEYIVIDWVK